MNQRQLAAALGITPARVSQLRRRGMPCGDLAEAEAWRRRNLAPYMYAERPTPAPPAAAPSAAPPATTPSAAPPAAAPVPRADEVLDLATERARLTRCQRIEVELRIAKARGEYAPIGYIGEVLAAVTAELAQQLEAAPGMLKRTHPELSDATLEALRASFARFRNSAVDAIEAAVRRAVGSAHYEFPDTTDENDDETSD